MTKINIIFPLEFIHLISAEANEICEKESKKTIAPEHILTALKVCTWVSSKSKTKIEPPKLMIAFRSWALRST